MEIVGDQFGLFSGCFTHQRCIHTSGSHVISAVGYMVKHELSDSSIEEISLEVKPPTIWTDREAEVGRVRDEKESVE